MWHRHPVYRQGRKILFFDVISGQPPSAALGSATYGFLHIITVGLCHPIFRPVLSMCNTSPPSETGAHLYDLGAVGLITVQPEWNT